MDFFYCYDKKLLRFLRYERNISFICTGYHIKTHDQFYQFAMTDELDEAIKAFNHARKKTEFGCTMLV